MSLFRPLLQRSSRIGRAFSQTAANRSARISIVGRLGAKPEVSENGQGPDMIRYALATKYGKNEREVTSWFRVACFANNGALRQKMLDLEKGSLLWVEGDAYMHKYKDESGKDMKNLRIVQRHIEFLDTRTRDNAQKQAAESVREESSEGDQELEGDQESSSEFREDEDEDAGTNAR